MAKEINFADQLKELEEITAWFESDEVDLDKGLAKFERGMELAAALKQHLASVENRVEKIKQKFDSPTVVTPEEPTEPEAGSRDLFSE